MKLLLSLTLLHQTSALSYERTYSASSLKNRVLLDKAVSYLNDSIMKIHSLALNITDDEGEVEKFNADSASLHIDLCVAGSLTSFKLDFIEDSVK